MQTAPCLAAGYLISGDPTSSLYEVDLAGGNTTSIYTFNGLGSGNTINSLAYNPLDNYLYGTLRGPTPEVMLRIGFDGSVNRMFNLPLYNGALRRFYVGDIDVKSVEETPSLQSAQLTIY